MPGSTVSSLQRSTHCFPGGSGRRLQRPSTIGLVQQLCGIAQQLSRQCESAQSLADWLLTYTEKIHEAVAWFGTQLLTSADQQMHVPSVYADLAERLSEALKRSAESHA